MMNYCAPNVTGKNLLKSLDISDDPVFVPYFSGSEKRYKIHAPDGYNIFEGPGTETSTLATMESRRSLKELNEQLVTDGLTPIFMPKKMRAEDLGHENMVLPTKYGGFMSLPLGSTEASYEPDSDRVTVNSTIIYGTGAHSRSLKLLDRSAEAVEKYCPDWLKKIVIPYIDRRRNIQGDREKSKKYLRATVKHELDHKKQRDVGLIGAFLKKYRGITDKVRDYLEMHNILYTSRAEKERTTDPATGYGELEDLGGTSRIDPAEILRIAEKRGPDEAVRAIERNYPLPQAA